MNHPTIIERREDMSPAGALRLMIQEDGDIVVCVRQSNDNGFVVSASSVEFTTKAGGGASPRTLAALRSLATAMALDSLDPFCKQGTSDNPAQTPPQLLVDRFHSVTP